jgi:hypothetical protein
MVRCAAVLPAANYGSTRFRAILVELLEDPPVDALLSAGLCAVLAESCRW